MSEMRFLIKGYNSDGQLGSFSAVIDIEGLHDFDEDALLEFNNAADASNVPSDSYFPGSWFLVTS
jgi:hypothetical protein